MPHTPAGLVPGVIARRGGGWWYAEPPAEPLLSPTYYGAAWVALGRIMLTTSLLGECPVAG